MYSTIPYPSPLGQLLLAADEEGLCGIWFVGQRHFARGLDTYQLRETAVLRQTTVWLERYFAGEQPTIMPPLHPVGTPFQMAVWTLLRDIPYGQTTTYGALAQQLARARNMPRLSAQAVGGAVGRNPLAIIVPCHRVVGANDELTGYAGGLARKRALLQLEQGIPL